MPTISVTWVSMHDDRVCLICQALDGYIWTFTDGVPDELVHPEFGVVWTVTEGSMAHGHPQQFCRCTIDSQIEMSDLLARVQRLHNLIQESVESPQTEVTRA